MRIRVTSVVWEEASAQVSEATASMQDKLNEQLSAGAFHSDVDVFVLVVISVGDEVENAKFIKNHSRIGTDKHPFTGELVKSISVAVGFDPEVLKVKDPALLEKLFSARFVDELASPRVSVPKALDYQSLFLKIKGFLE